MTTPQRQREKLKLFSASAKRKWRDKAVNETLELCELIEANRRK